MLFTPRSSSAIIRNIAASRWWWAPIPKAAEGAAYDSDWLDVGGQLMPRRRLEDLCRAVAAGQIDDVDQLHNALLAIRAAYEEDAWAWARHQTKESLRLDLDKITVDHVADCVSHFCTEQQKFLRLVLLDAEREYDEGSRIGFGFDGNASAADDDFAAVRGTFAANSFVKQVTAEIESLPARCAAVANQLKG